MSYIQAYCAKIILDLFVRWFSDSNYGRQKSYTEDIFFFSEDSPFITEGKYKKAHIQWSLLKKVFFKKFKYFFICKKGENRTPYHVQSSWRCSAKRISYWDQASCEKTKLWKFWLLSPFSLINHFIFKKHNDSKMFHKTLNEETAAAFSPSYAPFSQEQLEGL